MDKTLQVTVSVTDGTSTVSQVFPADWMAIASLMHQGDCDDALSACNRLGLMAAMCEYVIDATENHSENMMEDVTHEWYERAQDRVREITECI